MAKTKRNLDFVTETFSFLNIVKYRTGPNNRDTIVGFDNSLVEGSFFAVDRIFDDLYVMTLANETKNIRGEFLEVLPANFIRFNLETNDVERLFAVYITPIDSLIAAKFSSNFYIHIYAQHIFNNAIDKIYLVFITADEGLFFQIVSAYNEKNGIPPEYFTLQNACQSTILKRNLNYITLPLLLYQRCDKYKKYIYTFFNYMERFNKNCWCLRHETCKIRCDWYSTLPEILDFEKGLIRIFPRVVVDDDVWQQ